MATAETGTVTPEPHHPYTDDMRAMLDALVLNGYLGPGISFETISAGITPTGIAGEGYDARRLEAAQVAARVDGNEPKARKE